MKVTVLSGFLGSGKTTLLRGILHADHGLRIAVIVNDMAELNIDTALVKSGHSVQQVAEKLVSMQNGCICCTLREDLLVEVRALAEMNQFDYLVIESTGISEPMQVAETFSFEALSDGQRLDAFAQLDTMVTLVDAAQFSDDLVSLHSARVKERKEETPDGDEAHPGGIGAVKTVAELLLDQIEFADVILLNKVDLVSKERRDVMMAALQTINPAAKVVHTIRASIPLDAVLGTGLFSMDRATSASGWMQQLRGSEVPETTEFGVCSFVYRARRPFAPARLYALVSEIAPIALMGPSDAPRDAASEESRRKRQRTEAGHALGGLWRSKGFVWLATRHDFMGEWHSAGAQISLESTTAWMCEFGDDEWADFTPAEQADMRKAFEAPFGDRRQEIVLIGQLDQPRVKEALDACLLTDKEMATGPEGWVDMSDPFPDWDIERMNAASDEEDHYGSSEASDCAAALEVLQSDAAAPEWLRTGRPAGNALVEAAPGVLALRSSDRPDRRFGRASRATRSFCRWSPADLVDASLAAALAAALDPQVAAAAIVVDRPEWADAVDDLIIQEDPDQEVAELSLVAPAEVDTPEGRLDLSLGLLEMCADALGVDTDNRHARLLLTA